MSWAKAKIEIKPASVGTGIKVALRKAKRGGAKMRITVTGSAVGETGWADGDGIEVLIGEGEHHGLVRLRKNKSAAQTKVEAKKSPLGNKATYLTIPLGHQEAFVDRSESACWCQWEKVEDGWIEVVLPKWADETAPRSRTQPQPAPSTAQGVKPPAHRPGNVTASIMGDPPPGRREMLERAGKVRS